jgi:membrane fusion protein, multidrug efflux system
MAEVADLSRDISITPGASETGAANAPSRLDKRKLVLAVSLLALASVGVWQGERWWTVGRFMVSTDDAYVSARSATISAKVSGYVASVDYGDNANVKPGDLLIKIDNGDYRLAVQSARNNAATQQAVIARLESQGLAQQAAVDQTKAQLDSAQAGATRAESELQRQQELAARDFSSKQKLEQAVASRDQGNAEVKRAEAALAAAQANVQMLKAQQEEARRTLAQFETALAKAERDLSFTEIRAPFGGMMGNRAVQIGDYVQPGQRLASLVPLDAVYVDANFKETQLGELRRGQPVQISVDALPGREIEGAVESIAPASGSVFSLLPPENATGNFTKIVQRVPVRVSIPASVAHQHNLRPGMSVYVSVNTKAGAEAKPMTAASLTAPHNE